MGGKSGSSNSAMIKEQQAQATEARQKEVDRQTRLQQGLANIRAAFQGGTMKNYGGGVYTVPGAAAGAQSGGAVAGLPAGYTYFQQPGTAGVTAPAAATPQRASYASTSGHEQNYSGTRGVSSGGSSMANKAPTAIAAPRTTAAAAGPMMIRGPDGRLYKPGEQLRYTSESDAGASAGFGEDFYNRFKQGMLDYFTPQVAQQYGDAKDELTYRLARAGTGRSSVATDETAKLAEQNRLNQADVVAKADTGAADLRSRVASEQAKAESQLYATENPDVASNQALAAVRNLSLEQPNLSPLGEIFKVGLIGGANALTGYKNQQLVNQIPEEYRRTGTNIYK